MIQYVIPIVIIYLVALFILLGVSDNKYSKKYYVPVKVVASACFVAISCIGIFLKDSETNLLDLYMLGAFVMCFLGDLFMGFYNQKSRKKDMYIGMITFMLGHVGFLTYLYMLYPYFNISLVIILIIAVGLVVFVMKKAKLNLGKVIYPGIVYTVFISSVLAKCVTDLYVIADKPAIYMGVGGILFFLSDFSIMFLYFYDFEEIRAKKYVHYFNLITYYLGVGAFALSMLYR